MVCNFQSSTAVQLMGVPFVFLFFSCNLRADDWPQWRGPERDGIWREAGILKSIPQNGLPVRWRARILNGWSGPAVAKGRVYVTDHDYQSTPEVERVLCFDERTGQRIWMHEYACPYENMEYGNGPRATPTIYDGLVYTLGTMGHLRCLNSQSGELVWKKDPETDWQVKRPRYGVSASPLVVDDVVIVSAGATPAGTATAFDRKTGEERWRALSDRPAYSSPILIKAAGRRQVILWTGDNINSLDPSTGKLLWQVPYKASFDPAQATATPVRHKDKLLCLAGWNRGSMMLQLDTEKPEASIVWKTRSRPSAATNTPVFRDEKHIYTIVADGSLCCLDAETGDEIWATRKATSAVHGMAHIVPNGDQHILLNQQGQLILAQMSPQGYEEIGRTPLIEPTAGYRAAGPLCWAHPAFANRHIFARNDRELICVSLDAEAASNENAEEKPSLKSTVLPSMDGAPTNQTLAVTVSPDGSVVALTTGRTQVQQIERSTGMFLPSVKPHRDWVSALAFSPDEKYLVSAGGSEFTPERNGGKTSGEIKVWDRKSNSERGRLPGHANRIFAAIFSPDGQWLATGAADQTIRLWDIEAMRVRKVLRGHGDAISALAWSRAENVLVSASWDTTLKLWDTTSSKELATLTDSDEALLSVAISPDGEWIAAGGTDWKVRLWNLKTREFAFALTGHRGAVYSVAFSPDGATLATASGDETVRLWDLKTKSCRHVLRGHGSVVNSIAFTPNGKLLISGAMYGPVRVWNLSQGLNRPIGDK